MTENDDHDIHSWSEDYDYDHYEEDRLKETVEREELSVSENLDEYPDYSDLEFTVVPNQYENSEMKLLPNEIWDIIFSFIPFYNHLNIILTCKHFHYLLQQDTVWNTLITKYDFRDDILSDANEIEFATARNKFAHLWVNTTSGTHKARKMLDMLHELHKRGYVLVCRVGLTGSGMFWQIKIADKKTNFKKLGFSNDRYIFGIDAKRLSPVELADAFIAENPQVRLSKREPNAQEKLFIMWYDRVMNSMKSYAIYFNFSNYDRDFVCYDWKEGIADVPSFDQVIEQPGHPFMK